MTTTKDKRPDPRLILRAALGNGPMPDGAEASVTGTPGQHATIRLDLAAYMRRGEAAFDTSASGIVGTDGGADYADRGGVYETSPARILALTEMLTGLQADQSVPALTGEPLSVMRMEAGARVPGQDAAFADPAPMLTPHELATYADYSSTVGLVSPGFEDMLLRVMMASSDRLLVQQLLTGDGAGANLRGIIGASGVLTATYATADKGKLSQFFDAEDMLAVDTPADRRAWIVAEDLFRAARRTVIDPGSGEFSIRRGMVNEDTLTIRTNTLAMGTAIYGEWTALSIGMWGTVQVVVDRISQPGTVKLTMLRWVDSAITRRARFVVLSEA